MERMKKKNTCEIFVWTTENEIVCQKVLPYRKAKRVAIGYAESGYYAEVSLFEVIDEIKVLKKRKMFKPFMVKSKKTKKNEKMDNRL